ncbi:MAG: hypothetical protein U1E51_27350, partial [Candidatus Binatia bacterium]|nr:hypothetical protein [Candidatus Binatia bacterium]
MEPEKKPAANGNTFDGRNGRQKWIASLENILGYILKNEEPEQASFLVELIDRLRESGLKIPHTVSSPYVNPIPADK